jgi:nucleoside-diphosphate-sugar epimerase
MRVIVSGASGFVGRGLLANLVSNKVCEVVALSRSGREQSQTATRWIVTGGSLSDADWSGVLAGVTAIIHAAGRAHVTKERSIDPLAEYRQVNVIETLRLARLAAASGVMRFIYISSIKVNGEWTAPGAAFNASDPPAPFDAYALSKWEAEQGLTEIARQTGIEVVIVRPPLVYGPGVKANFRALMLALYRGFPLPLGAIHNRRSYAALDNLVDLLVTCIEHPAAANQTFMVSDGEDVSTTDLLRRMGQALGNPARLIPVPKRLLTLGARLLGNPGIAQRLCGSLQVDISKTRQLLNWTPAVSVDEGLRKTAEAFLRETHV